MNRRPWNKLRRCAKCGARRHKDNTEVQVYKPHKGQSGNRRVCRISYIRKGGKIVDHFYGCQS